jgi:hypothetical protein
LGEALQAPDIRLPTDLDLEFRALLGSRHLRELPRPALPGHTAPATASGRTVIDGRRVDGDPGRFHTTITFDEQSDGKCVLTMRQLHPTKEQRDAGIGIGAVEYGYQTLDKLARRWGVG